MLSLGTLAFIGIVLFMIHEFEEIACVRPYIRRNRGDRRFASEMFVAKADRAYPSTETVAVMIAEEFVMASLIMGLGIAVGSVEIVLAPFAAFTLHLIGHVIEAVRFPGWAPGSRTAVALLLPSVALVVVVLTSGQARPLALALLTLGIGAALLINLLALHSLSGWVEARLRR
ncbi:MAG: HXXEE domain-containing protein [Actinomycetaceae bacterium]|nr:HXXEE domain-containing protein [Actinomycetaceae bacterium]